MISVNKMLFIALLFTSCYSFKGIVVPTGVETFYVENFTLEAYNAPSNIEIDFTEALRKKMREEARLQFSNEDPHVSFKGSITGYNIGIASATEGDLVSLNRLTIIINVQYEDSVEPENNYNKTFTEFEDFDGNTDVQDVQEALITQIFNDILEKLFNDTYTNW